MAGVSVSPLLLIEGSSLCLCGCGERVKPGNRWIVYHTSRLKGRLHEARDHGRDVVLCSRSVLGWVCRSTTPLGYAAEVMRYLPGDWFN